MFIIHMLMTNSRNPALQLCASRGRHKEAIDHLEAAKRIYRQSRGADSDSESWWRLHDELAQAYSKGDNSAKEIENYEEAIRIVEVSGDASEVSWYCNI